MPKITLAFKSLGAKRDSRKKTITKEAICRMAKRAGVRRISGRIYNPVRSMISSFLESIIRDSVIYTEHWNRKTVTVKDVVRALAWQGRGVYL